MNLETIQQKVSAAFPETKEWRDNRGIFEFVAPALQNLEIARFLFSECGFQFLTDIAPIHYPDRKDEEICVVSHFHNLKEKLRLRMKTFMPVAQPDTYSLVPLFSGADWMERESYDYFGVNFIDHPNLKRILNVDEMDYFPMRKEYQMEDPTRKDKDDEMFGRI